MYVTAIYWPSPATRFPNAAETDELTTHVTWVPEAKRPSPCR
jgi:hypothetical protein